MNVIQLILMYIFQYTNDYRMGYAFLGIFMAFLFVFSLGLGPPAWFISTELCSLEARAKIQSAAISSQYITCFASSLLFFPIYHSVGPWSFLLFICPLTFCALYLYFFLPETKNRPIDEILEDLQRRSLLSKPLS
jgi:predicted MFS family arabinose efflux permease